MNPVDVNLHQHISNQRHNRAMQPHLPDSVDVKISHIALT